MSSFKILFQTTVFIVFLVPQLSLATTCLNILSSDSDLVGESIDHVRWSGSENSQPEIIHGVKRVGKENVTINYHRNSGVVSGVEILMPDGRIHSIKVTKGFSDVPIKITEQDIASLKLEYLPVFVISQIKKIRFTRNLNGLGAVSSFLPRTIVVNFRDRERGDLTFIHEAGHVSHMHTKNFYFKWRAAVKKDNNIISRYGNTEMAEDFAETFVAYNEPDSKVRELHRRRFPNRFRLLDEITLGQYHTNLSYQKLFTSKVVGFPIMLSAYAYMYALVFLF